MTIYIYIYIYQTNQINPTFRSVFFMMEEIDTLFIMFTLFSAFFFDIVTRDTSMFSILKEFLLDSKMTASIVMLIINAT